MRKQIANIITISRIVFSICMLPCAVISIEFNILYLLCGITDMVDGTIARKTKSISEFGARMDTAADFIFTVVSSAKILPFIHLPGWLWIWIFIIATMKSYNILWGFIRGKRLICIHTILNKITGFLLFLFPLTLGFIEPIYSSVMVCIVATVSAINEIYYIRIGREVF